MERKVRIINEMSGSAVMACPLVLPQAGNRQLIGKRTWGPGTRGDRAAYSRNALTAVRVTGPGRAAIFLVLNGRLGKLNKHRHYTG